MAQILNANSHGLVDAQPTQRLHRDRQNDFQVDRRISPSIDRHHDSLAEVEAFAAQIDCYLVPLANATGISNFRVTHATH
jgi:hypothetical protein